MYNCVARASKRGKKGRRKANGRPREAVSSRRLSVNHSTGRVSFLTANLVLLVANIPSVSDNLHSADHLTDGEEAQDLGSSDTDDGPRLAVHAAEGNGAGESAEFRGQCGGLAEGGDDRAEVLLEGSGRPGERIAG